jgi:uncharacterized repeat protein (TIGR03803 family)
MPGKISSISLLVAVAIGAVAMHAEVGIAAPPTKLTTVVNFNGQYGALPINGSLLYRGQTLYGATYSGGLPAGATDIDDFGAVFSIPDTVGATITVLHAFSGPDGSHPNGGLVADGQGNLYGTTSAGGAEGLGTVFKLTNPHSTGGAWTETTLHSFAGPDGASPIAGVTLGPDGSIYGAAPAGGSAGTGTIYKIPPTGTFQIVHDFTLLEGMGRPETNLVVDPAGTIVGTVSIIGAGAPHSFGGLFAIPPTGKLQFVSTVGGGEAVGNILRDSAGNIYGTSNKVYRTPPFGAAIWKVTAITHVWSYLAVVENEVTAGGVTRDSAGNLYATTTGMPNNFDIGHRVNGGTVFTVTPSGTVTTLATLGFDNQSPQAGVVLDPAGNLWGTSAAGGVDCRLPSNVTTTGCGTVFVLSQ